MQKNVCFVSVRDNGKKNQNFYKNKFSETSTTKTVVVKIYNNDNNNINTQKMRN